MDKYRYAKSINRFTRSVSLGRRLVATPLCALARIDDALVACPTVQASTFPSGGLMNPGVGEGGRQPNALDPIPAHKLHTRDAPAAHALRGSGRNSTQQNLLRNASPLATRKYTMTPSQPSSASLGIADKDNDLAYLESVEATLLDSIQKLRDKLSDSRSSSLPQRSRRLPRKISSDNSTSHQAPTSPQPHITAPRHMPPPQLSKLQLSTLSQGFVSDRSSPLFSSGDLGTVLSPRLFSTQSLDTSFDSHKSINLVSTGQNLASHHQLSNQNAVLPLLPQSESVSQSLQTSSMSQQPLSTSQPSRQRIISVSLHLPTKCDRETARQQLFDSRLPPKGMFALEKATELPFVWIGAPDPTVVAAAKDNRLLDEQYGLSHTTQWRYVGGDDFAETSHRQSTVVVPVALPTESSLLESFYKFCDKTLWNLLHHDFGSFASDDEMGQADQHWNAYRVVNQRFAEAVSEIYEDGDLIWVHNYHLMLLPTMLRQRLWFAKIGFFLYTPFPSAEVFRILPFRADILKGVLGADLVGFHAFDYSKQFTASCTRLLGLEGTPKGVEVEPRSTRHCELGIYPAGIDVRELKMRLGANNVKSRIGSLRRRFGDCKVIVGIDRLDDAFAGIPLKLLAFEKFLNDNKDWRGRVVLVQVASISKQFMKATFPHRTQINEIVARINSQYGTLAFSPVHYINEEVDPAELLALMCVGHVCLMSVVRDGMGLLPYEWTVCQHGGHKGCIILSEFAGAAASFATALHVNPWNVDEVSDKILEALEMKRAEREMRDTSAYAFVATHTASSWGLNFLEDLEQRDGVSASSAALSAPLLDASAVFDAYFSISSSSLSSSSLASLGNGPQLMSSDATEPMSTSSLNVASESSNALTATCSVHGGGEKGSLKEPWSDYVASSPGPQARSYAIPTPLIRRQQPRKKLFVLDYEGTLVSFQAISELTAPSPQLVQLIQELTSVEAHVVMIQSGRDCSTLSRWFGHLDVFLAAEDGSYVRVPGETEWIPLHRQPRDDSYNARHGQSEKFVSSFAASVTPGSAGVLSSQGLFGPFKGDCNPKQDASVLSDLVDGPDRHHQALEESKIGLSSRSRDCHRHTDDDPFESAADDDGEDLHPLLAGPSRYKWSMSSFGSSAGLDTGMLPEWKAQVMPVMAHFAERTPGVVLEEGDATLTWHFIDADKEFGLLQARDLQKHLESFLLQHLSVEVVSEEGSGRYPTRWVKVRPSGVGKAFAVERALDWIRDEYHPLREHGRTNSSKSLSSACDVVGLSRSNTVASGGRGAEQISSNAASFAGGTLQSPRHERSIIDFILCVGDDRADESMFDLLKDDVKLSQHGLAAVASRIFTCRVGSGATSASFMIESPQKVVELLEQLVSHTRKVSGDGPASNLISGQQRPSPSARGLRSRPFDVRVGSV